MAEISWYDLESPLPRPRLEVIADSHDTDKNSGAHDYTQLYSQYFDPIRYSARAIVEIGVWRGESLRMWREYFPDALVFGIDIDSECVAHRGDRIGVYTGSQSDVDFLLATITEIGRELDVVIDDGSHLATDYRVSFETLFPLVRSGGWYVIEDTN